MTIENLTGQDRILLWDITGQHPAHERVDAVAKALRLIGKLTEALAAAERRATRATASADEEYVVRKAAERDRDAARALLQWIDRKGGMGIDVHQRITDHLSGQPAAPAPAASEAELADLRERVNELEASMAAAERQLEAFGESTMRLVARAEAAEARVMELETHNASLRERNTELVHLKQVAEARVRELEVFKEAHSEARRGYAERVAGLEDELAALRERVARAERVFEANGFCREMLEALRGE